METPPLNATKSNRWTNFFGLLAGGLPTVFLISLPLLRSVFPVYFGLSQNAFLIADSVFCFVCGVLSFFLLWKNKRFLVAGIVFLLWDIFLGCCTFAARVFPDMSK